MVERISKEEGKLLAQDEYQRATEELKVAKLLHENSFYYKSVTSAYYAVYHAAKAALLLDGIAPQSHEGIERMFSLYYVKPGKIGAHIGKIIGRLMKLRSEADYYPETPFNSDDSSEAIEKAEIFVKDIQKVVYLER
ncbi:MAG TPA: HEPN domain-containing protein [Candidatus Wunengus sp. YC60]|uniref:HEPN domain-containing protein n=1 Tax=Candidatus Wunengus sp. YC60 TaxID=3367697 RepID=UPI00402934D9